MDHSATVGAKIKALRTEKKYTLKQLSEGTGLSVGFLSQVERGLSILAVDSLAKIAVYLGVPLSCFFGEEPRQSTPGPVVHSFDLVYRQFSANILEATLSHDRGRYNILPRLIELMPVADPKENSTLEMHKHSGDEFLYVLEGIVTVPLDGMEYVLYPGDSIQISSGRPHNWLNTTNKIAKLLCIHSPNPFQKEECPED